MEDSHINDAVADVVAKATVDESVAAYLALPKAVRRAVYAKLPGDLKKPVRAAAEARRGIAFRTQDGDLVFTIAGLMAEVTRLKQKHDAMDERKRVLAARMVELQTQAATLHGDSVAADVAAIINA